MKILSPRPNFATLPFLPCISSNPCSQIIIKVWSYGLIFQRKHHSINWKSKFQNPSFEETLLIWNSKDAKLWSIIIWWKNVKQFIQKQFAEIQSYVSCIDEPDRTETLHRCDDNWKKGYEPDIQCCAKNEICYYFLRLVWLLIRKFFENCFLRKLLSNYAAS